jgi:hypothetical protein
METSHADGKTDRNEEVMPRKTKIFVANDPKKREREGIQ